MQGRVIVSDTIDSELILSKPDGKHNLASLFNVISSEANTRIFMMYVSFLESNFNVFAASLKSWDNSLDLVNILKHEIKDGQLSFRGKRVLEVCYGFC